MATELAARGGLVHHRPPRRTRHGTFRHWSTSGLAETIAENGDRQRAETIAGWTDSVDTLAWIAESASDHEEADRMGEHETADAFVSRLHSAGERARALVTLAESDRGARESCADPGAREAYPRRGAKRAVEALAAEAWTEIPWVFEDGSGPLTLAVRIDPRRVDALLEPES
ncbi:hypothetical protein RB200_33885 [Streptomyces sp. PmtG]